MRPASDVPVSDITASLMSVAILSVSPDVTETELLRFVRDRLAAGEHVQVVAAEPIMSPRKLPIPWEFLARS